MGGNVSSSNINIHMGRSCCMHAWAHAIGAHWKPCGPSWTPAQPPSTISYCTRIKGSSCITMRQVLSFPPYMSWTDTGACVALRIPPTCADEPPTLRECDSHRLSSWAMRPAAAVRLTRGASASDSACRAHRWQGRPRSHPEPPLRTLILRGARLLCPTDPHCPHT